MKNLLASYLNTYVKDRVSAYCCKTENAILLSVSDDIKNTLYSQLFDIYYPVLEKFTYNYAAERKQLLLFIRENEEDKCTIRQLKEDAFNTLFFNDRAYTKKNYPRLIELATLREQQFFNTIDEFLLRFKNDKKDIERHIFNGEEITSFFNFESSKGDLHNHGRSTIIVNTNVGKIVYKPRDMIIDVQMKHFFDIFFADITKLPIAISFDGYGYSEYIENKPATCDEDARLFFENFGKFSAVALFLNSTDLHLENILSDGIHPIPIDLEMMISPMEKDGIANDSLLLDDGFKPMNATILSTGMMSYLINGAFEMGVLFSKNDRNLSLPVIDGCKKNIIDYEEEFLGGFKAGYLTALEHRKEIIDFFTKMPSSNIRFVIRNTNAYHTLIKKLYTLDYISDPDIATKVKNALSFGFKTHEYTTHETTLIAETNAILEGNIPFFYTKSDDNCLYDINGPVLNDAFEKSCITNVISNINRESISEMEFECEIIEKAVSRVLVANDKDASLHKFAPDHIYADLNYLDMASDLTAKIMNDKVIVPSGDSYWLATDLRYTHSTSINYLAFGNGSSGIIAYLNTYASICDNKENNNEIASITTNHYSMILHSLNSLSNNNKKISSKTLGSSIYTGIAGLIHSNEVLYNLTHSKETVSIREHIIKILPLMDFTYEKASVYLGISGLIKVLCKYDYYASNESIQLLIENLCNMLLERRKPLYEDLLLWETPYNNNIILTGYGSGQCGIASALSTAGKLLNRADFIEAANIAYTFVDKMYSEKFDNYINYHKHGENIDNEYSYSNGTPGIGFAMLNEDSSMCKKILERAINSCMNAELAYSDNLYDGNCAIIDFLLEAGNSLNRPELITNALDKMHNMYSRSIQNGDYTYIDKKYKNFFEPCLLKGASGIAYTLLRCHSYDKISSLQV